MTPLVDGSFVIRALDLCLEVTEQPKSEIHISGVSSIQLNVVDKVKYAFGLCGGYFTYERKSQYELAYSDIINFS